MPAFGKLFRFLEVGVLLQLDLDPDPARDEAGPSAPPGGVPSDGGRGPRSLSDHGKESRAMRGHAGFLACLALSAMPAPVMAQDQPAPQPVDAPPRGGPQAASREPNPDAQAIGDLLALFIKAYNARDA